MIDGPKLTVRPGPSRAGRPNACGVGALHLILRISLCRDLERRYGYFLDHVERRKFLTNDKAASYVTPDRVDHFLAELQARVSSVTVYARSTSCPMAQLLAPGQDSALLTKIERVPALVMQPGSKFDRLVYSNVLLEAGMMLMAEADAATHRSHLRAPGNSARASCRASGAPSDSSEEFCRTEIGRSFKKVNDLWWIVLSAFETKENRADERRVDTGLAP